MNAHLAELLHVRNRAQIPRVHDVGAVLIFERAHHLAGLHLLFQQKHLIGGLTNAQRWRHILYGDRRVDTNDIPHLILLTLRHFILPAAGVGAGSLIRVAFVHIAGEQAATGVGHAERAMDKDFQLHLRDLLADLSDLLQRQLA